MSTVKIGYVAEDERGTATWDVEYAASGPTVDDGCPVESVEDAQGRATLVSKPGWAQVGGRRKLQPGEWRATCHRR